VEVRFANPDAEADFLAGYSADVEIIIAVHDDVLRIPTQALLDGNKVYVYRSASGVVQERIVHVGLSNWDNSEIVEGLQEGEAVVTSTDRAGLKNGVRAKAAME